MDRFVFCFFVLTFLFMDRLAESDFDVSMKTAKSSL